MSALQKRIATLQQRLDALRKRADTSRQDAASQLGDLLQQLQQLYDDMTTEQEPEQPTERLDRQSRLLRTARDELETRVLARTAELAQANVTLESELAERKRAEEALRESNELLERMFAETHMAVAYLDKDFNFIRVNQTYAAADDQEPEFFIGKNHFDLYPHEENQAIFTRVVETGEPCHVFAKPFAYAQHPERGITYWDWSLQPVHDAHGQVGGLVFILLDVTDRQRALDAVEAERERLYSLLNMLPGYVALCSPTDYKIRFVNRTFHTLFGDPEGTPCYRAFRGRSTPCTPCEAAIVLTTGRIREWEKTGPSGRTYHVWGYPFVQADGSRLVLEMGVDITARRRLEKQVLEISSRERQRIGEDMHDSLGQKLTGISFLSRSLAQRLARAGSPESDKAAEIGRLVSEAVSQTRTLARGLCPVELKAEGLVEALNDLTTHTQGLFGIPCVLEQSAPVPVEDNVAATHLYSIAQEALNNAVKHARPQHISVRLQQADSHVTLTIRDDGVGIPEHLAEDGGMGLDIMKHRARLIGASIRIEPHPEGGTIVECVFENPPIHKRT